MSTGGASVAVLREAAREPLDATASASPTGCGARRRLPFPPERPADGEAAPEARTRKPARGVSPCRRGGFRHAVATDGKESGGKALPRALCRRQRQEKPAGHVHGMKAGFLHPRRASPVTSPAGGLPVPSPLTGPGLRARMHGGGVQARDLPPGIPRTSLQGTSARGRRILSRPFPLPYE